VTTLDRSAGDGILIASLAGMSTENSEADPTHNPNAPHARHPNGVHGTMKNDFVHRAQVAATELPSRLDDQLRRNPYVVLAIACAAGTGLGIVLSSRILRAVVTAAATAAIQELARKVLREDVFRVEGTA
jgi:broad specificity phosphatase PhoE